MEVFVIGLALMLGAAVFSLVAAGVKQNKQADVEPEDSEIVTDDVRLVQSCNELQQLAAKVRKEINHG